MRRLRQRRNSIAEVCSTWWTSTVGVAHGGADSIGSDRVALTVKIVDPSTSVGAPLI